MSICVLSHSDTYDLRRGSLLEGWEDFLLRVRRRKLTRETKCVRCEIKAMCGMCPATGELENGDAENPVDFLCHVAHLRAGAIGIEVPAHGDCEYCVGGSHHQDLMRSADSLKARVAQGETANVGTRGGTRYLPIVTESATSSGGCSSGGGCSTCH
jgi:radical SAM protein with 4Fe4S-binding SPASM domain